MGPHLRHPRSQQTQKGFHHLQGHFDGNETNNPFALLSVFNPLAVPGNVPRRDNKNHRVETFQRLQETPSRNQSFTQ